MPSTAVRRGIWALGALIVLVALAVAALPFVASTQIVRDRIAIEMSSWSGYRVVLGDAPEIDVWPSFKAVLNDVRLSDWKDADQTPVMVIERAEIELSALAALSGNVSFEAARLIRPTLWVKPTRGSLYLPVAPDGGRIARSLDIARAVVATNPVNPDVAALPRDRFGTLIFSDGRIVTQSDGKDIELMSSLAGNVSWPALDRAGTLSANGIWRGEGVSAEISLVKPLLLFAGGTSPVIAAVKSSPATLSFNGTASLFGNFYIEGPVNFSTPSVRRMLEWSAADIAPSAAIGSIAIASRMSGDVNRLKFEDAEIVLDGNPGVGVLDVAMADGVPGISGTLAFENLDLRSFLSAFTPLTPPGGNGAGGIDTAFADRVNLDLRLSAARANAGGVALADIAATAQVKSGLAAFDISDATAFGGALQAGIRFDRKSAMENVEIRILGSDIDGLALGKAAKLSGFMPTGRGTISAILKGPGESWNSFLGNATGSLSATFGAGAVAGLDIDAFLERTKKDGFFALDEVSKGTLTVVSAELKASIADGVARIEKIEAKTARNTIRISGIVPYVGGGLALTGTVLSAGQPGGVPESAFFVGGSWNAPFISPVFQDLPME